MPLIHGFLKNGHILICSLMYYCFYFNQSYQSILFTVLFMMIMLTCGCPDWLNKILFCSVLFVLMCLFHSHLSLFTRNPVFGISEQMRFKPACAATESWNFGCSKYMYYSILFRERKTKTLIRLRECAGWSASSLFAHGIKQVFSRHASILMLWVGYSIWLYQFLILLNKRKIRFNETSCTFQLKSLLRTKTTGALERRLIDMCFLLH